MFDDKFELLERLRVYLGRMETLKKRMGYWMDESERENINGTISMLNNDIKDLEDELVSEDVCPDCGGTIVAKSWIEDTCGKVGVIYCGDCGKKWGETNE